MNKKLVRAKVQLQNENPFFAYLVMNMKYFETDTVQTMGVNCNGDLYYNPQFIEKLTEGELKGVLAHEVMHVILEHFLRKKDRDLELYNIATDLCINHMLIKQDFTLPEKTIKPYYSYTDDEYCFDICDYTVKNVEKKNSEEIYNELVKNTDDDKTSRDKIKNQNKNRFDEHLETENEQTDTQRKRIQDKWKQATSEAVAYARQKGNIPEGLELFVDNLLNEKVNWKQALYKYLTKTIPHDYSYARPSRRSHSVGVYMPYLKKESIEIVVSLDTSASISNKELNDFMSEINSIAKSFNNLNMKLIVCDSEIKEVYHIGNGDNHKINKLSIKGGGGTSHKPVYEYVKKNIPNTRLLINFTDGYTYFDDLDKTINTLWVICKHGVHKENIPFGEVIKLEDE